MSHILEQNNHTFTICKSFLSLPFIFSGSDLPENIAGYWIFTDDLNFNTGYPKATLEHVNLDDFEFDTDVKSIAQTLTGEWAPMWKDAGGSIGVNIYYCCSVMTD